MKGLKSRYRSSSGDEAMAELGHELGNVLNGLLGMTRLVRESDLNLEQDRWLKAIEQSGRQLRRLVDAFGPGPRGESGPSASRSVLLDGVELLEQAVLSHAPAALQSANRLLLCVDPSLPREWRCDPCLLRQLLDNLLGNALKFTREGEVLLEAMRVDGGPQGGDLLVLRVSDSGPGISRTVAPRMFEAYQKGDALSCEGPGNRGLGLFICQRIARAIGGEISWSAPAGGGVRFEVRLPGVLSGAALASGPPSRILRCLHCRAELTGPLERSVTGHLSRIGVAWSAEGAQDGGARKDDRGDRLWLRLGELPGGGGQPGPIVQLEAFSGDGQLLARRILQAPILESSLAPLLMDLALQWLWLRRETPDSNP
jgi:hypothetical protein